MRRKTSPLPTRLYKYALRAPTSNAALVDEQLARAHRYRNKLIEIELDARAKYRRAQASVPEIQALQANILARAAELDALRRELRSARAQSRSRVRAAPEGRDRARQLLRTLSELRRALREQKEQSREALQGSVERIRADANAAIKQARKHSQVYWGTYVLVEQAVEQMRRSRTDPHFQRWDGRGSVGVQLSGGLAASALFMDDTRVRIDAIPEDTFAHRGRSYRNEHRLTALHLRIGSDDAGKPIWASWPLILERPLPADGRVKSAWVTRRCLGMRVKWELCICVEAASFEAPQRSESEPHVASVNFGWRSTERGVRVAYFCGSDGASQDIVLPKLFVARIQKSRSLATIRDRELNAACDALLTELAGRELPEWLADAARKLSQRRSCARLSALALAWREQRFAGDEAVYGALEAWRKQDRRLLEWQVNNREKGYMHRREQYRLIGLELARRYAILVLEDTDFRAQLRSPQPEAERDAAPKAVRNNRTLAACGELRSIIKHMAQKQGCRVLTVPAAHIRRTCHVCGAACVFERTGALRHTCEHCSATWDLDENAARNLLSRADARPAAQPGER